MAERKYVRIATTISAFLAVATASACRTYIPPSTRHYDPPAAITRDNLIVPGVRIGPVKLGITIRELYATVGKEYNSTDFLDGNSRLWYSELELSVWVNENDHVYKIEPYNGRYATRDGIRLGSPKANLVARYGQPQWTKLVYRSGVTHEVDCYPGDTRYDLISGGNRNIEYLALGSCDDSEP
jgi:hypothetical protein